MSDQEKQNRNISDLCDYIIDINAPNPQNPTGISDLSYHRVMSGLHDDSWIEYFVQE